MLRPILFITVLAIIAAQYKLKLIDFKQKRVHHKFYNVLYNMMAQGIDPSRSKNYRRSLSVMKEHLDVVKRQFDKDNYSKSLGIVLDTLTDDTIQMHVQLREDMLNMYNRPHGGIIYSLADVAFSVLGNNKNNISVGLDCSITYHASPDPGTVLVVEGKILSNSRRTAAFLFEVFTEKEGMRILVATMKSVSYRTGKPINPDVEQ
jgi:acyl-CoA thioesterase